MPAIWKINSIGIERVGSADSIQIKDFSWYAYDSISVDSSHGYRAESSGVREAYQTFTFANDSDLIAYTVDSAFDYFFEAHPDTLTWMQGVESDLAADITAWQNRSISSSVSLRSDSYTVNEVDPF